MVGNDDRDFAVKFTRAPPVEKIGYAMQILRAEERDVRLACRCRQGPAHGQFRRKRCKVRLECLKVKFTWSAFTGIAGQIKTPLHAHEEKAKFVILVLVRMENICAMLVKQACDTSNQTLAIGAVDQEDSRISHCLQIIAEGLTEASQPARMNSILHLVCKEEFPRGIEEHPALRAEPTGRQRGNMQQSVAAGAHHFRAAPCQERS